MRPILLTLLAVLFALPTFAQKKPKIKGNRNLIEVRDSLPTFNAIEISDGLEVVMNDGETGYYLHTDENLVDIIKFDVINDILKVYTSHRITRKKKIQIEIGFVKLNRIDIYDGELKIEDDFDTDNLQIRLYGNSKLEMTVDAKMVDMDMNDNSSGKFDIKADRANFLLKNRIDAEANVVADQLSVKADKDVEISFEGETDELEVIGKGACIIKAQKLKASEALIKTVDDAEVYTYVSKELIISMADDTEIFVYGSPKIVVEQFKDKSKLSKKQ